MDLTPAEAARLGCGAKVVDLERAGRLVRRGGPLPAGVRNAVLLRDRCQCRVPGCRRRRYVDVHHIEAQSRGGEHSRKNCVALCSQHHRMLHEGKLQVEGDADREGALTVRDEDGDPIRDMLTTQCGSSGLPGHAQTLLAIMGRRGCWDTDRLCEASQLSVPEVQVALFELQLARRVTAEMGVYSPV
jgi:hypothetical protein